MAGEGVTSTSFGRNHAVLVEVTVVLRPCARAISCNGRMLALARRLVVEHRSLAEEAVRVVPALVLWPGIRTYAPLSSKRSLRCLVEKGRHAPDRAFVGHRLGWHSEGA